VSRRRAILHVIARQSAVFSTVIVRLDRTIQHSRDSRDETDKPLLVMTGGGKGPSDDAVAKISSAIVIWLTNHHRISWSGRATSGAGDALQDPSRCVAILSSVAILLDRAGQFVVESNAAPA
jgi:hypothetical protein